MTGSISISIAPAGIFCDTADCDGYFPLIGAMSYSKVWAIAFEAGWSHDPIGLRRCPVCTPCIVWPWPWLERNPAVPYDSSIYLMSLQEISAVMDQHYGPLQPAESYGDSDIAGAEIVEETQEDKLLDEKIGRLHETWNGNPDTSDHGFAAVKDI